MVFTNAQTTAFFTDAAQMGVPVATYNELANEGITTVLSLQDFDEKLLKEVRENLRRPSGMMPDPNNPPGVNNVIPQRPFTLSALSICRLTVAAQAVKYYLSIGRDLTPANMRWNNTLKAFEHQYNALIEKSEKGYYVCP